MSGLFHVIFLKKPYRNLINEWFSAFPKALTSLFMTAHPMLSADHLKLSTH